MTSPDHVQHLNVLNCTACGAPVPLGDSASTVCLRCGAVAPLPQAYRDLRDAERAKHATDAAARHLYQQLGKPPGSLAQWWSTVPLGWIYFFGWPIVFVAAGLAIPSWLDRMAPTLGFSAVDVLSQTGFFATIAAVMFLLFGVPLALAIYGYRRTKARGRLHMALAAAPPPREGGPMQCRSCGGALTVQPNALGANCDYCGADNLVNLPASWLAKLQGGVKYLADTVHEAAAEDQKVRADTRRQLLRQLGLLAAIIFLPLLGFGKLLDNDTANLWPPPLTTEIIEKKSRSGLLGTRDYKPTSTALYAQQDIPLGPEIVGGATWPLTYQNSECHPIEGKLLCRRRYIIPMQKGETLTISAMRLPAHVTRFKVAVNLGNRPYDSSGRIALTTQNELRYTAPWRGWHELEFSTTDVAPQEKPAAVFRLSTRISQPVTSR